MSFVWSNVSSGTIEVTTHVNEAKDNIDTLADNLGVSQYLWSEMPVNQDEFVGQPQIQELQDATDYIDTLNTCSSENAGYNGSVEVGDDNAVDATADSGANSGDNATVDATKYNTVLSTQNTGYDATANSTILSNQNTTVDSNQHGTYFGTLNSAVNTGYNDSDYTGPGS
jgi:hypothetical protein